MYLKCACIGEDQVTPCFGFWKAFFNWFLLMEWARSDRFCIIFGIKLTTVQLAYLCHTYFLCGSNRHRNSTLYVDTILFCSPSLLYYFRSSELNFSFFILKCKRLDSTFLNGGLMPVWLFEFSKELGDTLFYCI